MKANMHGRLCVTGVILAWIAFGLVSTSFADPRQWDHSGVALLQNGRFEWSQSTARDSNGMTVTTWSDMRTGNRNIYVQLINPAGETLWGNGLQLTNESHEQSQSQVVATNGGWIVAWIDYRNVPSGLTHREEGGFLWMQKLDYSGHPLWPAGGVCIDSSFNCRVRWGFVRMVSDHAGGATFAWATLTGGWGIYAGRISAEGMLAWPRLTVTVSGNQPLMEIVSDSDGGMVVIWQGELQSGMLATRVCADGSTPWGRFHRVARASSTPLSLTPDGAGGFYAGWWCYSPTWDPDIWAQRVDADGQPLWGADGIPVCNVIGDQGSPVLAPSFNGGSRDGCIMVWKDTRATSGFAAFFTQKLSPNGVAVWDSNGILLCDSVLNNRTMALTSDGEGGFVATWEDLRNTSPANPEGDQDIWALRVNGNGQRIWTGSIVPVCTSARDHFTPAIVPVNDGYLVLYENGDRISNDQSVITGLSLQKLDAVTGTRQFSDSGMTLVNYPVLTVSDLLGAPMSDGRTAVLWNSAGNHYQILDHEGHLTLNSDTAMIRFSSAQSVPVATHVCADGTGGVFVSLDGTFQDYNMAALLARIAPDEHVINNGQARRLWPVEDEHSTYSDAVCADGEGGCYALVGRFLYDEDADLHLTRWNSNCEPLWNTPTLLDSGIYPESPINMVAHPQGGCVVEWGSYGSDAVQLAHVDPTGSIAWNITLEDSFSNAWSHQIIPAGQTGFYLTAQVGPDVYRQLVALRVSLNGEILWPITSVAPGYSDHCQYMSNLTTDNANNLMVVWAPFIHSLLTRHIYGQKLSPAGMRMWGDSARVIADGTNGQEYPQTASDGSDGFVVAWCDYHYDLKIYGTHLTAQGWSGPDPYWVQNRGGLLSDSGASVNVNPGTSFMISDGTGEAVLVWLQDLRQSEVADQGIYAQRIAATGQSARNRITPYPQRYALYQNYPNPFNPATVIRFNVPEMAKVQLTIYNINGQLVRTLVNERMMPGTHNIRFDSGSLPSGMYFYRLSSPSFTQTRKMVLLK